MSPDLMERLSYLLNMHQTLRIVFENPENVYGFLRLPNHNAYFNGKAPMEIMTTGRVAHLYEVAKRVDALRGGGW